MLFCVQREGAAHLHDRLNYKSHVVSFGVCAPWGSVTLCREKRILFLPVALTGYFPVTPSPGKELDQPA
jgi:hypothetical protein